MINQLKQIEKEIQKIHDKKYILKLYNQENGEKIQKFSEAEIITVAIYFNDGIGNRQSYKLKDDYSIYYYEEYEILNKKEELLNILNKYKNINEIIINKNDTGTFFSFNIYKNIKDENSIKIHCQKNEEIIKIGEIYWVGQSKYKNGFENIKQYKLLKIIDKKLYKKLAFEGMNEEEYPLIDIKTGSIYTDEKNINEIQEHIIINKHKKIFIKNIIEMVNEDYFLNFGNNKEAEEYQKNILKKILTIM
jgi:hypothetical protein